MTLLSRAQVDCWRSNRVSSIADHALDALADAPTHQQTADQERTNSMLGRQMCPPAVGSLAPALPQQAPESSICGHEYIWRGLGGPTCRVVGPGSRAQRPGTGTRTDNPHGTAREPRVHLRLRFPIPVSAVSAVPDRVRRCAEWCGSRSCFRSWCVLVWVGAHVQVCRLTATPP